MSLSAMNDELARKQYRIDPQYIRTEFLHAITKSCPANTKIPPMFFRKKTNRITNRTERPQTEYHSVRKYKQLFIWVLM